MVPVILLSDGYIANGSEPWPLPNLSSLKPIDAKHRTDPVDYFVYKRNPETLAREWVVPGTPGLEHRVGGIEKDAVTGNISYDPQNHERQVRTRAAKVERVTQEMGELDLLGDESGDVLVIGWGGTFGALRQATAALRVQGKKVSHAHLRWVCPIEPGLDKIVRNFKHVLCAELNTGQLRTVLRARYLVDIAGLNKIQGLPFKVREVSHAIDALLEERSTAAVSDDAILTRDQASA
jgi:2-oxoglutarate ferredoxin oxidoreductase subunit alpha